MTAALEAELAELLKKATPGPWNFGRELGVYEFGPEADDAPTVGYCFNGEEPFEASYFAENVAKTKHPDWAENYANAALIVAAVNALPQLLAELKRLREENARLTEPCKCCADYECDCISPELEPGK